MAGYELSVKSKKEASKTIPARHLPCAPAWPRTGQSSPYKTTRTRQKHYVNRICFHAKHPSAILESYWRTQIRTGHHQNCQWPVYST